MTSNEHQTETTMKTTTILLWVGMLLCPVLWPFCLVELLSDDDDGDDE